MRAVGEGDRLQTRPVLYGSCYRFFILSEEPESRRVL